MVDVAASGVEAQLLMSFELGLEEWKLGFAKDLRSPKRVRAVAARDRDAVKREIALAKAALRLPPPAPVVSCYEAGRDGFCCTGGSRVKGSRISSSTPRASR